MTEIETSLQGEDGLLESKDDSSMMPKEEDIVLVQRHGVEQTARVSVSLSMQRNLGNYENCHFSIRYEQDCRPEAKVETTEELERLALEWIGRRTRAVDSFIRQKQERAAQHGQNQGEKIF